ncbi:MAG: AbrB/MazE/SpoVT family DNA-binding domain-containing protein [Gammaproteobacteria bacterium]|nr:AbrB/MazE/SpoVT family DNA-binding domain-containing protein [Gammaproteobacteria bacterium]MCY4295909.1 AbrB/MazE/SpoVT family DNA-binding domain-containing protein [Gammaproteobacteria bacterium]
MSPVSSRVFVNGNSQAVRIPREFRLQCSRVEISKAENGDLIIHSVPEDRGAALLEVLASFTDDYVAILEEDQASQPALEEREAL